MNITKSGNRLETSVYRKPSNTGLLLSTLLQPCWQKIQRLFTHHNDPSRTSPVIHSYCISRRVQQLGLPNRFNRSAINKLLQNIDNIDAPKNASEAKWRQPYSRGPSANSVKSQKQNVSLTSVCKLNLSFRLRRLPKFFLRAPQKRRKPLLLIINARSINARRKLCWGIQPDIYTNALRNTNILQSLDIKRKMAYLRLIWKTNNSLFLCLRSKFVC